MLLSLNVFAQAPALQGQKTIGGSLEDFGNTATATPDGGLIVSVSSYSTDGNIHGNYGDRDAVVIKFRKNGTIQWSKNYGGSGTESCVDVENTSDGGYIFAAYTNSNDHDVSGNHGGYDLWIVKLSASGQIQWQQCLGGSGDEISQYQKKLVQQTPDGGYITYGQANSSDGDITHSFGGTDMWVVKLDANGNILWQKNYGGSGTDLPYSLQLTADGGSILAGSTSSTDGDITFNHGFVDAWVLKLDASGNIDWQKTYGGSDLESAQGILQLSDGGYIFLAVAYKNDGDVHGVHNEGFADFWAVRLNAVGDTLWTHCYGGSATDQPYCIQPAAGNGFLLSGTSNSNDFDVSGNHGGNDFWVLKISNSGQLIWEESHGGSADDGGKTVEATPDGGCMVMGNETSTDGDVKGNHGGTDAWMIRVKNTSGRMEASQSMLTVYPNPSSGRLFIQGSGLGISSSAFISMMNVSGQIVFEKSASIENGMLQDEMNVNGLPAGIYFLQLKTETGVLNKEVMVSR